MASKRQARSSQASTVRVARLAVATLVVAACGVEREPAPRAPGEGPILVGEIESLSGPRASTGLAFHRGFALAIAEQNARGGIDGRAIEVLTLDDRGVVADAERAMRRLVEDERAVAIVGGTTEELARAATKHAHGAPFVSPSTKDLARDADGNACLGLGGRNGTPSEAFRIGWRAQRPGVEPGIDEATGYDCGLVLCAAMERTRTFDPPDLWSALLEARVPRGALDVPVAASEDAKRAFERSKAATKPPPPAVVPEPR